MINFDFAALRLIGLSPAILNQLQVLATQFPEDSELHIVRITEVHRNRVVLHDGHHALSAQLAPALQQQTQDAGQALAVGDWGLSTSPDTMPYQLLAQMPAQTQLARRNPEGRLQVLATNIDSALLVMGLDHDFNLRRLERYLALVEDAGVTPVVILSKADQYLHGSQKLAEVQQRLPAHIAVFALNTQTAEVAEVLAPWLSAGQTLVLLGSSGAGKSTLTNTLCLSQQATGGVRLDDSRGHHTTTARSLHLCRSGACIIDTPGLRGLQLTMSAAALSTSFSDIDALAQHCQFRDCQHQTEPGCAVRAAVDQDRLKNYQKLIRESQRHELSPLAKIANRAKWKSLMRSVKLKEKLSR